MTTLVCHFNKLASFQNLSDPCSDPPQDRNRHAVPESLVSRPVCRWFPVVRDGRVVIGKTLEPFAFNWRETTHCHLRSEYLSRMRATAASGVAQGIGKILLRFESAALFAASFSERNRSRVLLSRLQRKHRVARFSDTDAVRALATTCAPAIDLQDRDDCADRIAPGARVRTKSLGNQHGASVSVGVVRLLAVILGETRCQHGIDPGSTIGVIRDRIRNAVWVLRTISLRKPWSHRYE